MLESSLITLREGFEAALIIAIIAAYLRRSGSGPAIRAVWTGVALAVAVSLVAGVGRRITFDGLDGEARMRAFAGTAFAAAVVLTWMIFWMRSRAQGLRGELEAEIDLAVSRGSLVAVAAVAFFAVVREGLETALFLVAATIGPGGRDVVVGGLIGLVLAVALALLIYRGGRRVPLRTFFAVTAWLLIVFAAGLVARGVQFLQASGDVGSFMMSAYDLTSISWLTVDTQIGRFLAGVLGWDPRPSIEQVAVYLVYLAPVAAAFFAGMARTGPRQTAAQADSSVRT